MVALESLLGMIWDCARRCLMLSTEERGREDDCLAGLGSLGIVCEGSVGVGGVTSVVGVSGRFGGVDGRVGLVLTRFRPRAFKGVDGRASLCCESGRTGALSVAAAGLSISASACSCAFTLLLLLRGLNSPPSPPPEPPPAPDLTESESPLFFLLMVNALFSLAPGEGSRLVLSGSRESVMEGSTMLGTSTAEEEAAAESIASNWVESGAAFAFAFNWGEDKVRYPRWEWCGEMVGRVGFDLRGMECQ